MTSRQRDWQIRKRAQGRCVQCGRRSRGSLSNCRQCKEKRNVAYRRSRHPRIYRAAKKGISFDKLLEKYPIWASTLKMIFEDLGLEI